MRSPCTRLREARCCRHRGCAKVWCRNGSQVCVKLRGSCRRTSAGAGATQAAAAEGEQSKKGKKVRKKRKRQQEPSDPTTAPDVDSPEADLRARIAALEAENAELRSAPGGVLATSGSGAAGDASAAVSHDDTNGAVGAAAAEQVDMSAWDDYGLDELVVQALAAQSFTSPTPIQHECLPAAVLGNADLIGAAQTVRLLERLLCAVEPAQRGRNSWRYPDAKHAGAPHSIVGVCRGRERRWRLGCRLLTCWFGRRGSVQTPPRRASRCARACRAAATSCARSCCARRASSPCKCARTSPPLQSPSPSASYPL